MQSMAVVRYTLCCTVCTTHNYIRFGKQNWHCRVTHAVSPSKLHSIKYIRNSYYHSKKLYKMTTTHLPHKITEFKGMRSQLAVSQDCVILQYQRPSRKHREKCLHQFQRLSRWL